jgi:hypothetical protein
MERISTFNVEEVFTWSAPEHPRELLVKKVSADFVVLAQSILYNVPDSQERVDALKLLFDAEQVCIARIKEG